MYQIIYKKTAIKALAKLPIKTAKQFLKAFESLALGNGLSEELLDIKKLESREGFRLRIGAYRAIYRILDKQLLIEVITVGSRGDVYK